MSIDFYKYDFLDFGSGFGGCIKFAKKKLGGKKELGFENHKGRCKDIIKMGYNCINADITKIDVPKNCVRFVTISHVLEHLFNKDDVRKVISKAIRAATDFVFIEGPSFDYDQYLENRGFKFAWSEGHGHYTKVMRPDIIEGITKEKIYGYSLQLEYPPILDSKSKDIHPLKSPPSVADYDPKIHPKKEYRRFDKKLYRSWIFFVWLKDCERSKYLKSRSAKFYTVGEKWFK